MEQKHQHILDVTRSFLFQPGLQAYSYYVVTHAIHLMNKLPIIVLKNKCSYELLYEKQLTYMKMKIFGFVCSSSTLDNNRSKLDPRAKKCVFLGIKFGIKGYVLLDIKSKEIFISRNVIFYKNVFPYRSLDDYTEPKEITQKWF